MRQVRFQTIECKASWFVFVCGETQTRLAELGTEKMDLPFVLSRLPRAPHHEGVLHQSSYISKDPVIPVPETEKDFEGRI